mmetsp:Transcript_9385/g.31401  ORF Transcript_9385/g.31401 Transcript_9385/m.31401 type:complete len:233 (-) Transcript_9385:562-1260(-)
MSLKPAARSRSKGASLSRFQSAPFSVACSSSHRRCPCLCPGASSSSCSCRMPSESRGENRRCERRSSDVGRWDRALCSMAFKILLGDDELDLGLPCIEYQLAYISFTSAKLLLLVFFSTAAGLDASGVSGLAAALPGDADCGLEVFDLSVCLEGLVTFVKAFSQFGALDASNSRRGGAGRVTRLLAVASLLEACESNLVIWTPSPRISDAGTRRSLTIAQTCFSMDFASSVN